MSASVLERERCQEDLREREDDHLAMSSSRLFRMDGHSGLTLDDLITGVWEGLALHETVCCPACGGTMTSHSAVRAGAHDALEGGACDDCGVTLS
ncbi:MAG TPA: hypothetical protein VLJ42_06055 [Solirubrobacteraceae bacterium]|nr:hypothetical protein [Solirubrobacteraceae bacterium]